MQVNVRKFFFQKRKRLRNSKSFIIFSSDRYKWRYLKTYGLKKPFGNSQSVFDVCSLLPIPDWVFTLEHLLHTTCPYSPIPHPKRRLLLLLEHFRDLIAFERSRRFGPRVGISPPVASPRRQFFHTPCTLTNRIRVSIACRSSFDNIFCIRYHIFAVPAGAL